MTEPAAANTDPLVRSSLREALIVTLIWLAALGWSVGVSASMGYDRRPEDLKLIWGFPDWIFWGVVIPWLTCAVVSWLFGAFFVRDGELGQDLGDTDDLGLGG
ncbi:MAG: hypothetical protein RLZZ232_2250 [Planctomycetota bacterium]|jgi:uncharacterized SAM-binding protein YcdF (DUF218 family)